MIKPYCTNIYLMLQLIILKCLLGVIMFAIAFGVAALLALLFVPVFKKMAIRFDFTDKPTERKLHITPIPLIGGVVMLSSFLIGFIIFVVVLDITTPDPLGVIGTAAVILGALFITGVGLVDDYSKTHGKEFAVFPRVFVHFSVAVIAFIGGIRFTGIVNPFTSEYVFLPIWLQFFLTVLWFMGLISVFNFMDGLDGLAGLLALLSGVTLFIVAISMNQSDSAFMAILLVGTVAGFLKYNLPPAKIYMGDSGAYLLGFLLAVISLHGTFKQATLISMFIPILAMGVPIFDSILVVFRRLWAGRPAYKPDNTHHTHIHYRLVKAGLKPTHAVLIIFLLSLCLNLASIIVMLLL